MKKNVAIETTSGAFTLEIDCDSAPATAANFLDYIASGHYIGSIFHRVIKGFMVQGGGFTLDMSQKPTRAPIKNEAGNGLCNKRGTIAMARTMEVDSATCQFFINTADNSFLDHRDETANGFGYCVFGRVVEGMDAIDKIENASTMSKNGFDDVPEDPITIIRAVVID